MSKKPGAVHPAVYGTGLVVADLADVVSENDLVYCGWEKRFSKHLLWLTCFETIAGSESDNRFRVLFAQAGSEGTGDGEDMKADTRRCLESTPLWRRIFAQPRHLHRILYGAYSEGEHGKIGTFLEEPEEFVDGRTSGCEGGDAREAAEDYVSTLYYEAKNWVYLQPTYFDELSAVQRRVDFTLGLLFVGFVGAWLSGVKLVWFVVWVVWGEGLRPPWREAKEAWREAKEGWVVFLVCVGICFVTGFGYRGAEQNFNQRVFGYFFSHVHQASALEATPGRIRVLGRTDEGEVILNYGSGFLAPGDRLMVFDAAGDEESERVLGVLEVVSAGTGVSRGKFVGERFEIDGRSRVSRTGSALQAVDGRGSGAGGGDQSPGGCM